MKRRHTILDKATLLEKGFKISDLDQSMQTHKKQNYDKHVEQVENWKDIIDEKDQGSKARLVPLFLMDWQTPMPNVMLEF